MIVIAGNVDYYGLEIFPTRSLPLMGLGVVGIAQGLGMKIIPATKNPAALRGISKDSKENFARIYLAILQRSERGADLKDFDEVVEHAIAMYKMQKARIDLQQEQIDQFLLNWDLSPREPWWQLTQDPQPHNAIRWLVDVLSVNEPQWKIKIPKEMLVDEPEEETALSKSILARVAEWVKKKIEPATPPEELAETYENLLHYMLLQNDQRQEKRLLRTLLLTGFVTDQVIAKCIDLRQNYKASGKPMPDWKGKSPIIYKALSPTEVLYEYDDEGLACVCHRYARLYSTVKALYGSKVDENGTETSVDYGAVSADDNGYIIWNEYWMRDQKVLWVEKRIPIEQGKEVSIADLESSLESAPRVEIDNRENTLGFIPIVIKTANGGGLDGAEVLPTNFAGTKSNIFHRANLFLSAAASLTYRRLNPQHAREGAVGLPPMEINYTEPHVYDLPPNVKLTEIEEHLDQDLYRVMEIIMRKAEDSTPTRPLVGQPGQGVYAAAAINIVTENAKIGTVPITEVIKETYREIGQMTFDYLRAYQKVDAENGSKLSIWTAAETLDIDINALPRWLDIDVTLEPDMPRDKVALWNMAVQAYVAHMIPLDYAWDVMGVKDKNAVKKLKDDEEADRMKQALAMQGARPAPPQPPAPAPQLAAQALAPNVAAGLPVEQNPQAQSPQEQDVYQQMLNAQKGVR